MITHGTPLDRLIVVDNGSNDGTREYLQKLALGGRIHNSENLGCGVAWNQGALALQADWTIVMNNDVLVSANWVENLIGAAIDNNVSIMSPAMIEGKLSYDFNAFAPDASEKMKLAVRMGWCHAVCLAVHKSVWLNIGYFQPVPKLLGYEDALFFNEMEKAKIPHATTGSSWLHHYGSITQSAMKRERGLREDDDLAYRYNHRLLQQSWLTRKLNKLNRNRQLRAWRDQEMSVYGMTMQGKCNRSMLEWV
jgi:GT2 family glycosyltransferase